MIITVSYRKIAIFNYIFGIFQLQIMVCR